MLLDRFAGTPEDELPSRAREITAERVRTAAYLLLPPEPAEHVRRPRHPAMLDAVFRRAREYADL